MSLPYCVEMLSEAYMLAAVNFTKRKGQTTQKVTTEIPRFKVGDLVLFENHKKDTMGC